MDTAESVEKTLERLMPRGMSVEGARALDSLIDELAGEAPAPTDWVRIGVWSTGAMAAALALFFGLHGGPAPDPADSGPRAAVSTPRLELVSVTEGVVAEDPQESLVAGDDGSLHREWRRQVVTEERFHDSRTGHDVRVVHPRDEIVMVPVTSF